MRISERTISLILIIVLISAGLLWAIYYHKSQKEVSYKFKEMPAYSGQITTDLSDKAINAGPELNNIGYERVQGKTNYKNKTLLVDKDFSSHLPIVVIDTGDDYPEVCYMWDQELLCNVPIEGMEPYVNGNIKIINHANGNKVNHLNENPDQLSDMMIKVKGNSSIQYDKKQYQFKLTDNTGKYKSADIMGMGSENEWILNVSFVDKSLIRNFLAFSIANEIMPYTPDVKYCEVIWKHGEEYDYQGVYLMMESVKVGKNRVDLPEYHNNSEITPMLIRRDRFNPDGLMLENYSNVNDLAYGFLELQYPKQQYLSEEAINSINSKINQFEEVIYSDKPEVFFTYTDYINIDSFVDYFIINELLMNYDAGYNSTYIYYDEMGKLNMGPVWDFDQALDNDYSRMVKSHDMAFHSAPWFRQLLKDPIFTRRIEQRYHELRKSILSDESIESFVKDTVDYLGPAVDRDWARWGYFYKSDFYLKPIPEEYDGRRAYTYKDEIDRILMIFSSHGDWLDENIDSLYQFKQMTLEDAYAFVENMHEDAKSSTDYSEFLAVTFVVIFAVSVTLVLRHESE